MTDTNIMKPVEIVGLGIHWTDLPVGRVFRTVGRTITETDLVNFISCTGMLEVLFTNVEFLKEESAIKGRVVPGALVNSFAEGLLMQSVVQGVGLAFLEMQLSVNAPTFVGDTIHVQCEVIECRESKSKPGFGLVRTKNRVFKHDGTLVQTYTPLRLLKPKGQSSTS